MYIKKMKAFLYVIAGVFLFSTVALGGQMRFWHDLEGNEYQGEFVREAFGKINLRGTDGHIFNIVVDKLIDADIRHIQSLIPQKLKISFDEDIDEILDYPPEYDPSKWNDHEMVITGTVEVEVGRKVPYVGSLRGELYFVAREMYNKAMFRLSAKKSFPITFPDENTQEFKFQMVKTIRNYYFNAQQEWGAEYYGYILIVEDRKGNLIDFQTDVKWMDEEKIGALRKLAVPCFMNEDLKRRSAPRPIDDRSAVSPGA